MALTKILTEGIKDGEILNVDINASAAIARTKLANVDVVDDTTPQLGGTLASNTHDIHMADNDKLFIGTGQDMHIYHDGTNSYITSNNGFLQINAAYNEIGVKLLPDAAVELYYNNSKKFETTSSGVDIAGNCTITGNFRGNDNVKLNLGNGDDLQIYHDGTYNRIAANAQIFLQNKAANETYIAGYENGAVELYYDNVIRLTTDAAGVVVTGNLYQVDNDKLLLGNSSDLEIFHDGSNSYIKDVGTGSLLIRGSTVSIQSTSGEAMIEGVADGAVTIKHDNSTKLQTTSGGIDVTGTIDADDVIAINSSSTADLRLQYSANNRLVVRAASSSANIITQNNSDLALRHDSGTGSGTIIASVDAYGLNTGNNKRLQIKDNNGDVSGVIENWDSSANALKIGADPANGAGGSYISLQVDGSEQARIGDGISFNGDSATSNFLNDYERGLWTPTITGGGTSISYGNRRAWYVKIGEFVLASFYITFNAQGDGNQFVMGGLPFTSNYDSPISYNSGGNLSYVDCAFTNNAEQRLYVGNNGNNIYFYHNASDPHSPAGSIITTTSVITSSLYGFVTYQTDS